MGQFLCWLSAMVRSGHGSEFRAFCVVCHRPQLCPVFSPFWRAIFIYRIVVISVLLLRDDNAWNRILQTKMWPQREVGWAPKLASSSFVQLLLSHAVRRDLDIRVQREICCFLSELAATDSFTPILLSSSLPAFKLILGNLSAPPDFFAQQGLLEVVLAVLSSPLWLGLSKSEHADIVKSCSVRIVVVCIMDCVGCFCSRFAL